MMRRIAALTLILALVGCDDTTLTRVERRSFLSAPKVLEILKGDALLVEVHGLPWPGANSAEVVGTLRMPEGPARDLRFQQIPAGQGHIGGGYRMVLRFNPAGGIPTGPSDCTATSPLPVDAPQTDGFTVNATFCKGTDWEFRVFAESGVDSEDWLGYFYTMEKVLGALLPAQ